jgi:RimJ/RimL family protein N-acetyltransferase
VPEGPRLATPDPPLADGAVRLRPPAVGDVPAIVAACRDAEMARWLPRLPHPYGPDDAHGWIAGAASWWEEGSAATFVVEDARGGGVVGAFSAEPGEPSGFDVGWWLAVEARGHGRMTRAATLAAAWLFDVVGTHRLQAFIRPDNAPSIAVAERVGFQREGLLRRGLDDRGQPRDVLVYGLLPADLS